MPTICSFADPDLLSKSRKLSDLGSGTFGSVALYETPLGKYVVKETRKSDQSFGYPPDFITEIDALFKFRPIATIIQIEGVCFDTSQRRGFILLEAMQTNLRKWFLDASYEKRLEALPHLISQIGGALAIMHKMGFVHGDIKHNNVLANSGTDFKLADFGKCTYVTNLHSHYGAISRYQPYQHGTIFYDELYAFCVVLVETIIGANMISLPRGASDQEEDKVIRNFYRQYRLLTTGAFDVQTFLKERLDREKFKMIPDIFWGYVLPIFINMDGDANKALTRVGLSISTQTLQSVRDNVSVQETLHPKLELVQKRILKILNNVSYRKAGRYMSLFERLMSKFLYSKKGSRINDEGIKYYSEVALVIILGKRYNHPDLFENEAQLLLLQRSFLEVVGYQSIVLPTCP